MQLVSSWAPGAEVEYPRNPAMMRRQPRVDEMRAIEAFASLNDSDLARINACALVRRVRVNDEAPLRRNGAPVVCFAIDAGFNLTVMSPSGRQVIVRSVRPGAHFGEDHALTDATITDASALCVQSGDYIEISSLQFRRLLRETPALTLNMLEATGARARAQEDRVFELSVLGLRAKLKAEILRLARDTGLDGPEITITRAPTHEQFASLAGGTREGVTREMRALAEQGLIRMVGRRELLVPNIDRLAAQLAASVGARALHQFSPS
jgi:CRP-like cAMP-binding protein